jgi:uncharacterized protein YydD (DUF2326 family)
MRQKMEHINENANVIVPDQCKARYEALILKHFKLVSVRKNYLSKVKKFFHDIHMKDNEPVYRKQIKILDAHIPFLEKTLTDWLK